MWGEGFYSHCTLNLQTLYSRRRLWYIGGDHSRGIKTHTIDIPGDVGPFWFAFSRDAVNLSIYCLDV